MPTWLPVHWPLPPWMALSAWGPSFSPECSTLAEWLCKPFFLPVALFLWPHLARSLLTLWIYTEISLLQRLLELLKETRLPCYSLYSNPLHSSTLLSALWGQALCLFSSSLHLRHLHCGWHMVVAQEITGEKSPETNQYDVFFREETFLKLCSSTFF